MDSLTTNRTNIKCSLDTADGLKERDSVHSNWSLVHDHGIMLCLEARQHLSLTFHGQLSLYFLKHPFHDP